MPHVRVALVLVFLAAIVTRAPAALRDFDMGAVRGRVTVINPDTSMSAHSRPMIADLGGTAADPVDRRHSVVYFDEVPRRAFDDLPTTRVRMDQRNEQFVPRVLAITAGSVVEFPNSDTKFHNVFSLSKPHPFDLGRYAPGRTGSQRFDRPGLVRVFCDIHSHMSGYILVFSHRYFVVTDDEGRYAIANVPSGTYTLAVWSEGARTDPKRVTVPDGGTAEVDFQVSRVP